MKHYSDFYTKNGWFAGNVDLSGPIQMGYKKGDLGGKPLHYHSYSYEYFIILNGRCSIDIEDKKYSLDKGSIIVVEPNERHILYECSPDLEVFLIMDAYYKNDTIIV